MRRILQQPDVDVNERSGEYGKNKYLLSYHLGIKYMYNVCMCIRVRKKHIAKFEVWLPIFVVPLAIVTNNKFVTDKFLMVLYKQLPTLSIGKIKIFCLVISIVNVFS